MGTQVWLTMKKRASHGTKSIGLWRRLLLMASDGEAEYLEFVSWTCEGQTADRRRWVGGGSWMEPQ